MILFQNNYLFISVCKEALEVLTLCLFLKPNYLKEIMEKKDWQTFIIDLILLTNNRFVYIFTLHSLYKTIKISDPF